MNLTLNTAELEPGKVMWQSPSNIALVKYWGKHGRQLPRNPNISFTLHSAVTQTQIEYAARETLDARPVELEFFFHDQKNEAFQARVEQYLAGLLDVFPFLKQLKLTIRSGNSFPHSAGIASSASAMSALALGLCSLEDNFFGTLDSDAAFDRKASRVARLGSGSACRSIYGGLAAWGEHGGIEGSSDEYAVPVETHAVFQTFHDDILIVGAGAKSVSSSAGHGLMDGNPYAEVRYQQARQRMHFLLGALRAGDVETVGKTLEDEALTLHALMMASNPSYLLMRAHTINIIEIIRLYRRETGHPVYFSLDAGPNVHVLYPESVMHAVRPFIEQELVPLCEEGKWLADWVGEGPEQMV